MADIKTPLSAPAQDNLDALIANGAITPETAALFGQEQNEQVPLPATSENQLETEQAQEANELNDAIVPTPGRQTFRAAAQDLSDADLLEEADKLQAEAASEKPAVEIAEDIVADNAQKQQRATEIKDAIDIKDQTEANRELLKSQIAQEDAVQQVAQEEADDTRKRIDAIQAEIESEQQSLKSMSMNDIFEDDNAPITKTQAILAMIIGGIGAGLSGGPNLGVQSVNKTMDDYFNRKKLGLRERLSKKQRVFDLLKLQLDKQQQSTDNELKKTKIEQLKQQMEQGKIAAQQAQIAEMQKQQVAKRFASAEGLSREEVFALNPKMQEKAVFFSDGKARFAPSAQSAKKLRDEILPSAKDAIRGMTRLKELSEQFAGGSLSLEARAEAQTIQQALKGALRLELFGPGVMTDAEQKLADKIIGNPTKLTGLTSLEKRKLDTLMNKIVQGTKDKLRISGIEIPESKNEKMIQQLQKNNKGLRRQEAMSALIEKGFWNAEEMPF